MTRRAQRSGMKQVQGRLESAATELQALAGDITAVIDTLPKNTSSGSRELLEQHARRALAIAAALRVESRDADPKVAGPLMAARRAVAVGAIAAVATVGTGLGERAGAEVWERLTDRAEQIVGSDDAPPTSAADDTFPNAFESVLAEYGITKSRLARQAQIPESTFYRWISEGTPSTVARLHQILEGLRSLDVPEGKVADLERLWMQSRGHQLELR